MGRRIRIAMAYFSNGIAVLDGTESTDEELRKMIMSFRIPELQHLLGFGNRSKLGKKNELIHRAVEFVRNTKSLQVQEKVRELYRRRLHAENRFSSSDVQVMEQRDSYRQSMSSVSPPLYNNNSVPNSVHGPYSYSSLSTANSHINNVRPFEHSNSRNVKLISLPFYDMIYTLIKPTALRSSNPNTKFQENYLPFSLNAQQMEDIKYPDSAPLPRMEIQLRFCLYDLSGEQKDDFPPGVEVRINEKPVILPNLIPTNKPGVEPKRPSRAVNVTSYCRDSQPQRMHVYWAADSRNWTASVYFVRRVNSDILLQRLQQRPVYPAENSKRKIKNYLSADNDIATTSLRVSLSCPIGKMRMRIPSRLQQCQHLQCFDADLFLKMNEKKPTWICPVCDKPTPFQDLIVDEYFTEVLKNAHEGISEIELLEDGQWLPVKEDDDNDDDDSGSETEKAVDNLRGVKRNVNSTDRVNVESTITTIDSSPASNQSLEIDASSSTSAASRYRQGRPLQSQINRLNAKRSILNQKSGSGPSSTAAAPPASEILIDLTGDSDDEPSTSTPTDNRSNSRTAAAVPPPPLNSTLTSAGASSSAEGSNRGSVQQQPEQKRGSAEKRVSPLRISISGGCGSSSSATRYKRGGDCANNNNNRSSSPCGLYNTAENDSVIMLTDSPPVILQTSPLPRHSNIIIPDDPVDTFQPNRQANNTNSASTSLNNSDSGNSSTDSNSLPRPQLVSDLLAAAFRSTELTSNDLSASQQTAFAHPASVQPSLSPTSGMSKKRFKRLSSAGSNAQAEYNFTPYVSVNSMLNGGPTGVAAVSAPLFDFTNRGDSRSMPYNFSGILTDQPCYLNVNNSAAVSSSSFTGGCCSVSSNNVPTSNGRLQYSAGSPLCYDGHGPSAEPCSSPYCHLNSASIATTSSSVTQSAHYSAASKATLREIEAAKLWTQAFSGYATADVGAHQPCASTSYGGQTHQLQYSGYAATYAPYHQQQKSSGVSPQLSASGGMSTAAAGYGLSSAEQPAVVHYSNPNASINHAGAARYHQQQGGGSSLSAADMNLVNAALAASAIWRDCDQTAAFLDANYRQIFADSHAGSNNASSIYGKEPSNL